MGPRPEDGAELQLSEGRRAGRRLLPSIGRCLFLRLQVRSRQIERALSVARRSLWCYRHEEVEGSMGRCWVEAMKESCSSCCASGVSAHVQQLCRWRLAASTACCQTAEGE